MARRRSPSRSVPSTACASSRASAGDGNGGIVLGALASHASIVAHPEIRARFTGLADASAIVGSHATRNTGTIGGNVMNGSPAMDTGAPLICAGAVVTLASSTGTRDVAVADLFVGPGRTSAAPDELLTSVLLPGPAAGTGSSYVRLEYRRQMEIAIVGVGCQLTPRERRLPLRRAHRDHGARAHDPPHSRSGGAARGRRGRRGSRSGQPRTRWRPAAGRSPTSAARIATAARWPPSSHAVRSAPP